MVGPITISLVTGLLFTAVYNVTGSADTRIGYQTGCPVSSVSGTDVCVLLANGTVAPVPENVQDATYTQLPTPTFILATDFLFHSVLKRSSTNIGLTLTSINGFQGPVSLSVSVAPIAKHPPAFSFSPSTVTLLSGGSTTSVLTVSAASNTTQDTYVVTVTGKGGAESASIQISVEVIP